MNKKVGYLLNFSEALMKGCISRIINGQLAGNCSCVAPCTYIHVGTGNCSCVAPCTYIHVGK